MQTGVTRACSRGPPAALSVPLFAVTQEACSASLVDHGYKGLDSPYKGFVQLAASYIVVNMFF